MVTAIVDPSIPMELPITDLSDLEAAARDAETARLMSEACGGEERPETGIDFMFIIA